MVSNADAEGLSISFAHELPKVDVASSAALLREVLLGTLSEISCVEPLAGAIPLGFTALLGDALLGASCTQGCVAELATERSLTALRLRALPE